MKTKQEKPKPKKVRWIFGGKIRTAIIIGNKIKTRGI
jgi:hypothetical protein